MLAEWDAKLITPAEALTLVGDLEVYATHEWADLAQFVPEGGGPAEPGRWQINLRCALPPHAGGRGDGAGRCGQSCGMLAQGPPGELMGAPDPFTTNLGDLLSAVLRHQVMAHDMPLNQRARKETSDGQ